jgi:hypothetical protein
MSDGDYSATRILNPEASRILEGLLDELRTKPASARGWARTVRPDDWNLQDIAQAKAEVVARYTQAFSGEGLNRLDRETMTGFLHFKNNHHWYGLDRLESRLTADIHRLRAALQLLTKDDEPLKDRLDQLRPPGDPPFLPGLGPAVITAILQILFPDRYGVLNQVTARGMKRLGLWPALGRGSSFSSQYMTINGLLLATSNELGTDLWTLDFLWWFLVEGHSNVVLGHRALALEGAATRTKTGSTSADAKIGLPSGLHFSIEEASTRMLRFCREEYAYYDGIPDVAPDSIEPVDVLATLSMNSFVNDAAKVRRVHRGIAGRCDSILPRIPVDADLMSFDADLREFHELIHAAVQAPGVLIPVATKVLHRKRPGFIPMLDNVVVSHYAGFLKKPELMEKSQSKQFAASVAVEVTHAFREDLSRCALPIAKIRTWLSDHGFELSPLRILEVLIWTETERNGYYRDSPPRSAQPQAAGEITMVTVGTIQTELIYSRLAGKATASAIVPPDSFQALEADRARLGVKTVWWYDADPQTKERRPAFTPIQGKRLALIEGRGIRHGDRFIAIFEVKDVTRQDKRRNEMWLVDARPLHPRQ